MSVRFPSPSKGTQKQTLTGRGLADQKPQLNQRMFLRVTSLRDRRFTGQQLQAQLNRGRSKQVLVSTVNRRLRVEGLTGRVAARKALLRFQNKTMRRLFQDSKLFPRNSGKTNKKTSSGLNPLPCNGAHSMLKTPPAFLIPYTLPYLFMHEPIRVFT